ncbi:uncharacterized protein DNG_01484 [Cephalotrichum gorgonifer]|uniref:Exonuclease V n=1 Tax=Cephalotrichum gorgonifer TaxID=2041049 RepID=A0AAE8MQM4_9PEZI|nr:uncharacterized protein DNG_01484 [Cephalotrichum gorgonifer]
MATITAVDSFVDDGDDYYDLTPEEEALLCELDDLTEEEEALLCALDTTIPHLSKSTPPLTKTPFVETSSPAPFQHNGNAGGAIPRQKAASRPLSPPATLDANDDILYPDLTRALSALPTATPPPPEPTTEATDADPTLRKSPLVRFRTFPRKPFAVTDFTSGGAWCELQYYYTLTRLPGGKKTKTAAMKGGTKVHKKLEKEVHTMVRVHVDTKADMFALKLWNVIQGLRTLRDTGLTREMEVWGMVDGHLVTGVIDGLSYSCPDVKFEEEVLSASQEAREESGAKGERKKRTIYLSDVKTRGSQNPPTGAASLRPTKIQLFLYHRLLSEMAEGTLDFFRVLRRLDIDPDETFSDDFITEMASLHDEVFYEADPNASQESPTDSESAPDLVKYGTIRELLWLVKEELGLTFPEGRRSLGQLVSVDYRWREDGSVIGTNTFPVDDEALELQLKSDMQWWRGEREPRGVDIEDSFKCGYCEFAGDCEWRERMDEERLRKAREKVAAGGGGHY